VLWVNLGLIVLIATLTLGVASQLSPGVGSIARTLVPFGLQISGVFVVTWLLVERGQALTPTLPQPPEQQAAAWAQIGGPAVASIELIALTMIWGTGIGTAVAAVLARRSNPTLAAIATIASLVWIVPGFLIAILAQDLQSTIYALSGTSVSGSFGHADTSQLIWCAAVLGIRPAAYTFRQAQVLIGEQSHAQHVRTALAKGLPWDVVVSRHIIRPAEAGLVQMAINSMRLVVGLLPLVEFFFGYPGLGRQLLFALGVPSASDQASRPDPSVAVGAAVILALILVGTELPLRLYARRIDPRLAETS
jgi:ABC-type dipeptide/oligopeptide/nickel transport system permease component